MTYSIFGWACNISCNRFKIIKCSRVAVSFHWKLIQVQARSFLQILNGFLIGFTWPALGFSDQLNRETMASEQERGSDEEEQVHRRADRQDPERGGQGSGGGRGQAACRERTEPWLYHIRFTAAFISCNRAACWRFRWSGANRLLKAKPLCYCGS